MSPPPDPDVAHLRALADSLRAEATELARTDPHAAATRFLEARRIRETADELEARLRGTRAHVIIPRVQASPGAITDTRLVAAAKAKGMSLRELARRVGSTAANLSAAHAGRRPIPRRHVDAIERLTGFPATTENWPRITE